MTYDHIVIGVGGMGSATAAELARRGRKVLGLEQFDIPHDFGSSHGLTRIIRLAYNEHPNYVPLMRRSYEMWRELEDGFGEKLLFITGGLDAGPRDGRVFPGALAACELHNLEHEVLSASEVSARYPGITLPENFAAVFQPDGGFLRPEQCIVAQVINAQAHGADIRAREAVTGWSVDGEGVTVTTTRGTYSAGSLVITGGAWAGKLLSAVASTALPQRQVLGWFQPQDPDVFALGNFPVFILDAEEGEYYGFPIFAVPGFKLGRFYHREEPADPDNQRREVDDEDEEILRRAVRRYFPQANGATMSLKHCMFTNSPDNHFILDRVPGQPQVAVAAGFSGHGFKFCTVIGEIMADLAMDGTTRHDIDMFSMSRFGS